MHQHFKNWFYIVLIAAKRFFHENYTYSASALAFTTLLAIVPLISVIVFFFAMLPIFTNIILLAESYILKNFLPATSVAIQSYFEVFIHQASRLPTISILFLFVTAIFLINTIEDSLNHVWRAPPRRKNLSALLLYWCVILVTPFLVGLSVFVGTYIFSLSWVAATSGRLGINNAITACVPIIVNTLIFTLLYIIVPNIYVRWRDGLFGGLLAALLFEIAKVGFTFYVTEYPSYSLIYGVFATIPIFLLWLYISWVIILYGALLAQAHFEYYKEKKRMAHHK